MNSPTTAPAGHPAACAPTHPQSKGWLTAVLRPLCQLPVRQIELPIH
jgi:hypothetical protein